jgi:hypothetical protein
MPKWYAEEKVKTFAFAQDKINEDAMNICSLVKI